MTDHPPYRKPDDWDREYLLDVAQAATHDSWPLVGRRHLVEAICADYGAVYAELQAEVERHAETRARVAAETYAGKRAYADLPAAAGAKTVAAPRSPTDGPPGANAKDARIVRTARSIEPLPTATIIELVHSECITAADGAQLLSDGTRPDRLACQQDAHVADCSRSTSEQSGDQPVPPRPAPPR
jgi:hypothetical protein